MNNELLGMVDNLYCCDDRLGVELMGAQRWNALKRAVTNSTYQMLKDPNRYKSVAPFRYVKDPLTSKLFGFNDRLGVELLGGWWTDLKKNVASGTHKILEAGEKIPVADAAVDRFRDIASVFNFGTKGASAASTAYEWWDGHKWTVIIGGGAALVVLFYFLGKSRGKRA